jgi:transcriptional regulator with XRE-family HTH domain
LRKIRNKKGLNMKKGEFLLSIRKKHKASRAKFSELLEVSPSSIEKAEKELIPVTPENKYVKAVCALEGLDNEIFKYDEITEEILSEHELSKFSQAFRRFLYFYYGDFWNENIDEILLKNLAKTITYFTDSCIEEDILFSLIDNFQTLKNFVNSDSIDEVFGKEPERLFIEAMLIISLSKIYKFNANISQFELVENSYISFFKNDEEFNKLIPRVKTYLYSIVSLDFKRNLVIKELSDLEDKGELLTIENIKKLKKQKELEKIQDKVNIKVTDPKDQKILELLHYAPPAFKDKIIEKLEKFRDEVEKF